jgi:hypothetical protein
MKKTVLSMPKIYENEDNRKNFNPSIMRAVKPARYVWHVKKLRLLEDISIAESGLLKGSYGMVFVNNFLTDFSNMYPFCIDSMWELDEISAEERETCFHIYSYWRIDTKAFNGKWFIDPNMVLDCVCSPSGMPRNYLCTNSDIPVSALKNFSFVKNRFDNRQAIIKSVQGVSSYISLADDFTTLKPNNVINGYMEKYAKNKLGLSLKKVI